MIEDLKKKFNNWNIKKQEIHFSDRTDSMYFKEGQIWWCSIGQNIGSESYIDVTFGGQTAWVLLYQMRTFNKKRFQRKIGELDEKDFLRVKQKLEKLLEFSQ